MFGFLNGMRVVEGASFIAAPACGLHLAQLGAEVIRFDQVGGGPDFRRCPIARNGASLYWEGLNKGKKSIAVDLSRPEGRELALAIATAPGPHGGLFVTNFPLHGFLSYDVMAARRKDLICLRIMGWANGTQAVDYTINAAIGVPNMTGPADDPRPVNHVLPAWDLLAGSYGALALLAAHREREATGLGRHVQLALSDLAAATLGHLGQVAEVVESGSDRPRYGNDLFGAFGRDFLTLDGRRVMVVAITTRQWQSLVSACGLEDGVAALALELGVSFDPWEGVRFAHRERLVPLFGAAIGKMSFEHLAREFDRTGVCWSAYQSLHEALSTDARFFASSPIFSPVGHPSGLTYPTPGAAVRVESAQRAAPGRAPRLGEHTDQVLSEVLSLPFSEIARLHDAGIVAGAEAVGKR